MDLSSELAQAKSENKKYSSWLRLLTDQLGQKQIDEAAAKLGGLPIKKVACSLLIYAHIRLTTPIFASLFCFSQHHLLGASTKQYQ